MQQCLDLAQLGRKVIASAFRYEPCPALRDQITARDVTCRFPGCTRRAVTCGIDHVEDWNGYNTDGTTQWTSPLGRI